MDQEALADMAQRGFLLEKLPIEKSRRVNHPTGKAKNNQTGEKGPSRRDLAGAAKEFAKLAGDEGLYSMPRHEQDHGLKAGDQSPQVIFRKDRDVPPPNPYLIDRRYWLRILSDLHAELSRVSSNPKHIDAYSFLTPRVPKNEVYEAFGLEEFGPTDVNERFLGIALKVIDEVLGKPGNHHEIRVAQMYRGKRGWFERKLRERFPLPVPSEKTEEATI